MRGLRQEGVPLVTNPTAWPRVIAEKGLLWRPLRNIASNRELEALGPSLRVYDPFFGLFPGGSVTFRGFYTVSVLASEHLPELRREMRLAQDLASERDYVLEAAEPSDRLPFRALEDRTHFCGSMSSCLRDWAFVFLFRTLEGVLPLPGTRPFWVDDEGKPYPWVYWNSEARECRVMTLDPLETLTFDFLQSLLVGLGKRSNFRCRWILDHSEAEVGAFLDSLLADMEKQSRFDRLRQKMAEAVPAPAATAPAASSPLPAAAKKGGSSMDPTGKPFPVQGEESAKEDPSADLKKKWQKRKASGASAEEAALGTDSSWVHKVSPINRAFPDEYNFREALDAGLTNGPTREILGPLVPEQLLGMAQHLACQLTACLQIGIEKSFASNVQMEKELASLKDQVDVLTAKRDSALAAPLLNAEIKSLTQQLRFSEGERLSALARMSEVEERAKVRHLHPAIDFSMISLDTRWDPKAKRIYNPKAEAQEQSEPVAEEQPGPEAEVPVGGMPRRLFQRLQ
ncbi:hypothetical protein PIB30_070239 [Stylosanthes scabra]|uniref:Uncharacterized protein n=1 Tax=Stylosanthes scabra TaxID=79078 RepID=A0ABU6RNM5_9FABA|nr:hypothetical protein [Stylosanthes scabra]